MASAGHVDAPPPPPPAKSPRTGPPSDCLSKDRSELAHPVCTNAQMRPPTTLNLPDAWAPLLQASPAKPNRRAQPRTLQGPVKTRRNHASTWGWARSFHEGIGWCWIIFCRQTAVAQQGSLPRMRPGAVPLHRADAPSLLVAIPCAPSRQGDPTNTALVPGALAGRRCYRPRCRGKDIPQGRR